MQDRAHSKPLQVFYSYASGDERLRGELQTHLALMERQGSIASWAFRKIAPGTYWQREIDANLEAAHIILFLVSSHFIASDYCWTVEMTRALDRHRRGEATVIPIILRPCDWQSAPFGVLQALPTGAKPVVGWRPRDTAWTDVTTGLRKVVHQLSSCPAVASPAVNLARSIGEAKARVDSILVRGDAAVTEAASATFSESRRLVRAIAAESPNLPIRTIGRGYRCVVELSYFRCALTLQLERTATSSYIRFHDFIGDTDPEDIKFNSRLYYFRVRPDGRTGWEYGSEEFLSAEQLADKAVQAVLRLYRQFGIPG